MAFYNSSHDNPCLVSCCDYEYLYSESNMLYGFLYNLSPLKCTVTYRNRNRNIVWDSNQKCWETKWLFLSRIEYIFFSFMWILYWNVKMVLWNFINKVPLGIYVNGITVKYFRGECVLTTLAQFSFYIVLNNFC
jgi:hypothetical protein